MRKNRNHKNLPKGWRKVKLGEVAEIKMGQSPSSRFYNSERKGLPFFQGVTDFGEKYPKESVFCSRPIKIAEVGEILISVRAPVGEVNITIEKCCIGRGIAALSMKNGLNSFLYFLLRYSKADLKSIAGGTTYEAITKNQLENFEIEIPEDPNEQKRIADILFAFDEKIELNNRINQILEEMAQAIFKEWLLKNQRSKTKNQRIRDLTEIISGYPFKSKLYTKSQKGTLGVVTIKNVQDGDFITHCDSFIKKEEVPENMNSECFIKNGDILLSLTGNVGRVCFVYGGDYLLNQRVAKLKPINQKDRALVYFLFRQKSMQSLLINMAKGSAQPNLSPVETGEIEINLPYRDVLDKFAETVNPIYDYLVQNKVENQKLSALRDLLLPKLMSGEIRV